MSKGGNQQAPTNQTVTQTNIPKEFMPYYERLVGRAEAASMQPYQPYGAPRVAQASQFGDIGASQQTVRDLAAAGTPTLTEAQDMTRAAGQGALGLASMGPYQFSQFGGFQAGQASPFAGFQEAQASPFAGFQAGQASPFAGFQRSSATPFAGFQAGQTTPFADFQAGQASPFADFATSQYEQYNFSPTEEFSGSSVSRYMNPYMQQVVDEQKRQAQEDYDIARQGRNARAVAAGAFGGSRQAVQEGLAERDLLNRQRDIQAQGLSTAYGDAQRMFEADRTARMTTQQAQAGEAARVQSGLAAEQARVQQARAAELARTQGIGIEEAARVQQARAAELARTQGISVEEAARVQQAQAAELARAQGVDVAEAARVQQAQAAELARTQGISLDEASRIQAAQAAELARVQGIGVSEAARVQQARAAELARTQGISLDEAARIQAAQAAELSRVQGAQAGENRAAQQFGLDALGFYSGQAGQLASMSEQQRAAQIQNAQLLEAIGRGQQAEAQAGLDIGYQDYLRQMAYPREQLGFYSDVLQGLPVAAASTQTSQNYQSYNPLQQMLGAGLSGLSLYKAFAG